MDLTKHLQSRKYEVDRYSHHFLDYENEIATFYLFDEVGRWTGYQKYNPNSFDKKVNNSADGRYFNHNQRGELCVWGLEVIDSRDEYLFITESIFKSAAIHSAGFNSITQLTSGCSERFLRYVDSFSRLGMKVFFVGDFDKAGLEFSKYRPGGFMTERDLDESPTNELRELLLRKVTNE